MLIMITSEKMDFTPEKIVLETLTLDCSQMFDTLDTGRNDQIRKSS